MEDWITFFGRFHPLWVHLPIGFLVLAIVMRLYGDWKKSRKFSEAISFSLLIGTGSALIAALLGFLLSQSGGYEGNLLDIHQIGGWATVVFSGLAWWMSQPGQKFSKKAHYGILGLLLIGISVTGHFGGSLTHGEDYLTAYGPFSEKKETETRVLNSVKDAILYTDVIQPVLKNKCVSCHREGKTKGGLRLDSFESLSKGGEHGSVLIVGDLGKSELIRRVTLPADHEDFMPAEGKKPLTDEEIKWIVWWIEKGNTDPNLRLLDTEPELIAWAEPWLSIRQVANAQVFQADTETINDLKKMGFRVRILSQETAALDVVLPEEVSKGEAGKFLKALEPLKNQIYWLSLAGTGLVDVDLAKVAEFVNLRRLRIENNPITDQGLASLKTLTKLEVLNLNGTQITASGLLPLQELPALKSLYLWNTGIKSGDPLLGRWEKEELKVVGD